MIVLLMLRVNLYLVDFVQNLSVVVALLFFV